MTEFPVTLTNITNGANANAAIVNSPDNELLTHLNNLGSGALSIVQSSIAPAAGATTQTLVSGAFTATRSFHRIDTEGAAASDDLDTINGGADGDELYIRAVNGSHVVVVKHNAGNIYLSELADISLNTVYKYIKLRYDLALLKWVQVQTPVSQVIVPYVKVVNSQTKGTNGGTSTATSWHTRVLNTEVQDTGGVASVASNQVTLAAGTYDIFATAPSVQAGQNVLLLWNDTDNALALQGGVEWTSTGVNTGTRALVSGRITVASPKAYSLRHYITSGLATFGLGIALNVNDPLGNALAEIYATFEAWKVS